MAYTPINWQTGDTITADKLNRCDNGWSVSSTQLFSGSTTIDNDGDAVETTINPASFSSATSAAITVNGTTYNCVGFDDGGYWTFGAHFGDFSTYPFSFYREGDAVYFTAKLAGSYTLGFIAMAYEVGTSFEAAVRKVADSLLPLEVRIGSTTWQEVSDAMSAGRTAYVTNGGTVEYVTHIEEYSVVTITATSAVAMHTFNANDANSPLYA